MADGLTDAKIECIYEDQRGALWVGTHDGGVLRYEGDRFYAYRRRDGLAGNSVFSVLEDGEGLLWFGTNRGASRFDGETFENYAVEGAYALLWGSCLDREGMPWFGVERRPGYPPALCYFDGHTLQLVPVATSALSEGQSLNQVVVDGQGVLWCGGHGLYRREGDDFRCVSEPAVEGAVLDMVVDREGVIWVATEQGIFRWKDTGLERIEPVEGLAGGEFNWCLSLLEDREGVLWAMHRMGTLQRFTGSSFERVSQIDAFPWGGMCADRFGRLWVGTHRTGLFCYDATRVHAFGPEYGVPAAPVNGLYWEPENALWVGGQGGLARCADVGEPAMCPIPLAKPRVVTALAGGRDGLLWVGCRTGTLVGLDRQTMGECAVMKLVQGQAIDHLVEDEQGRLWFSSRFGMGLGYCQGAEIVYFAPDETAAYPVRVGAMTLDNDGRIWLGADAPSDRASLCVYDGQAFRPVPGLTDVSVLALCPGQDGCMWVGTDEGVRCLYKGQTRLTLRCEDGLSCEIITVLRESRDGLLWIGTDGGGVCLWDGRVVQVLELPDQPSYRVIRAMVVEEYGAVWLATQANLLRYIPTDKPPQVALVRIAADRDYWPQSALSFPSSAGRVTFHLSGSRPTGSTDALVYYYRLVGVDPEWSQTRNNQMEYDRLAPGAYTFLVHAVDPDLNYSDLVKVEFTVEEDPLLAALRDGAVAWAARILVVQVDAGRSYGPLLERVGYSVQVVEHPADALRLLGGISAPHLILLDAQLHVEASRHLLRHLRKTRSFTRVILLGPEELAEEYERTTYLPVPYDLAQLLGQIHQTLSQEKDPLVVYIATHPGRVTSRDHLARLFHISPGTVSNRVRRITGHSFNEYLQECRIEEAKRLLARTEMNIQQIAYHVGYRMPQALSRTFRQRMGYSPQQYRREIRTPSMCVFW